MTRLIVTKLITLQLFQLITFLLFYIHSFSCLINILYGPFPVYGNLVICSAIRLLIAVFDIVCLPRFDFKSPLLATSFCHPNDTNLFLYSIFKRSRKELAFDATKGYSRLQLKNAPSVLSLTGSINKLASLQLLSMRLIYLLNLSMKKL